MPDEPLVHEGEGTWRWTDPRLGLDEAFEAPTDAVEAGAEALLAAVEEGRVDAREARDLARDARFALGGHEHHLGADDRGAFDRLSELEDQLSDRSEG